MTTKATLFATLLSAQAFARAEGDHHHNRQQGARDVAQASQICIRMQ
jgi:hypothetical protein